MLISKSRVLLTIMSLQLIERVDVEFAPVTIKKWKSTRTGLQVVYINQPSPIVNGYFTVATEIADNSGCPHTLEHLVFMGSKNYPYKGLLDSLGNRYFSSTNAWTSTDQTVYTLTSAGWEGFRTLLPIYLDHLLNPTLTDEACMTEVYHIDGKGNEKGVVFSEMQGIETQSWFISFLQMQQTLYAPGSGYSSETGGLMNELRHLTNDQIRDFHKQLYRPDNLSIIIAGSINEQEMLETLAKFDNTLTPLPLICSKRPFVDSIHDEPLTETIIKEVEFPEKDESMGELLISWIGPKFDDDITSEALDMVGSYFCDNPISIFNKHLVEIEDPLATDIDYSADDYYRITTNFTISGVPINKLKQVDTQIKLLIKQHTDPTIFDLELMKQTINQQKLKLLSQTEKMPNYFQNCAIIDFIYGDLNAKNLTRWCKDLKIYDELKQWNTDQWCKFIDEQLVQIKSATIIGKPSSKLNKAMKQQNKKRKLEIIQRYGQQGLFELDKKLQLAQAKNDLPIPQGLLTQFGYPDPSNIVFIDTKSYKGGNNTFTIGYEQDEYAELLAKDDITDNSLFFHFEQFESEFLTIYLVMSTNNVDKRFLRYFSILEEIFNMSIQLPNEYLPYEKLLSLLNEDLIDFQLDNGFDSQFLEYVTIKVKCEVSKYQTAIDWLSKVMTMNVIEENRIKVIIEKIINSLPDKKRSEELMMYSKQYRTLFNENSMRKAQDSLHNEEFYKRLLDDINNGGFDCIKKDLSDLKHQLFQLDNIKVFVNGNCKRLKNPISCWTAFINHFKKGHQPIPIESFPRSYEFRSNIGSKCSELAYLVEIPAAESTHLTVCTLMPTSYSNSDVFKIALAAEYLNAVEGPFWRGIRGVGLAYGVSVSRNLETGYLNYTLYRGSDPEQAWAISKQIIQDFAMEKVKFEDISIENCVSTIINSIANNESNSADAATVKIADNIFRRRGPNYKTLLIKKLKSITANDLVEIVNKYFVPLFDPQSSVLFASVPPSKCQDLERFFTKQGYKVEIENVNIESNDDSDEQTDKSDENSESYESVSSESETETELE